MNDNLLHREIQEFISANENSDIHELLLKRSDFMGVPMSEIVEQIEARRRAKEKLPLWYNTPDILFPNKSFLQQSSSELTAIYKSDLISGETGIDITGGFGVDAFHFSRRFHRMIYCEKNVELAKIAAHNFKILKADNIEVKCTDGIDFLKSTNLSFDWLYADPSRRHKSKGKVFFIEDSEPDITAHSKLILKRTKLVLLKLSPMLDLSQVIDKLPSVSEVHLVAVENEMKELLVILSADKARNPSIICMDLHGSHRNEFTFVWGDIPEASYGYPELNQYLYEPNAAILKAGAFNHVSSEFLLNKLHPNSHLYTSEKRLDFPGRRFEIDEVIPYSNKKELKSVLSGKQANVSVRNFPISVRDLRNKYKIKDGGDLYVFFTTLLDGSKAAILCGKA